jgi:hypothetical protein
MQSVYEERFERDMACTEEDWLRWLPEAIGAHHWKRQERTVGVRIGDGALGLKWQLCELSFRRGGRGGAPCVYETL